MSISTLATTLTDVANALIDTDLPVPAYGAISDLPSTGPVPPHTRRNLAHIDCYLNDIISVVQGGPERQHQVFNRKVCTLKCLFPSLPRESKDSVSVKKLLAGEGGWTCFREVLGWIIETKAGTVALQEHKLQELQDLLEILTAQRRMGIKKSSSSWWGSSSPYT